MELSSVQSLPLAFVLLVLVVCGGVCALSWYTSYRAWVSALVRRASRQNASVAYIWGNVSLAFSAALVLPIGWGLMVVRGGTAASVLILLLLITCGTVLHAAFRCECIVRSSTDPRLDELARVPYAANRVRQILTTAKVITGPQLHGPILQGTLVRAAIALLAAFTIGWVSLRFV